MTRDSANYARFVPRDDSLTPDDIAYQAALDALPTVGSRVRLLRDVERYPHFIAPKGSEGTVTSVDEYALCVRLDEVLVGAKEWDNEVHWYPRDDMWPNGDLEVIA